jgi:osomolarity two-component system sensor histidine kinase SLN1
MCLARGLDPETVHDRDAPALVVGDETRLMQIVTNLASNACKFTPPGGRLRIATKLIVPACSHHGSSPGQCSEVDETEKGKYTQDGTVEVSELSASSLDQHDQSHEPRRDRIVVRIEVTDTGYGIPPEEMVQSKLFCTFHIFLSSGVVLTLRTQRHLIKQNKGNSKVEKGLVLASPLSGR